MEHLYDITEVCRLPRTTSRTLRFYEAQNLITGALALPSPGRRCTSRQLDAVKQILVLRALGLSVKTIQELLRDRISLREAILAHRAELLRLLSDCNCRGVCRFFAFLACIDGGVANA